jgi:hypothetical protein
LNAIQALSQLSYSPTKCNVLNALSPAKFLKAASARRRHQTSMRGAFYGTAVRCRNATAEAEVREAAVRFRGVLGGPGAAEAVLAALGICNVGGSPEAAGREAGAGRER